MSYLSAIYERDKDLVQVVERKNGKRIFNTFPAEYTFYYPARTGKYTSVYGDKLDKFTTHSYKEYSREKGIQSSNTLFESDFNPIARCLEKNYAKIDAPKLHTAYYDIETDFEKSGKARGFAPVTDPFNKITAIAIYLDWCDKLICLAIPPKTVSKETAQEIADKFDDTFIYYSEKQMLLDFMDIIEDSDVLCGWNSEGYDIPYTVNRITKILSKSDTRKMCLWDKLPKKRTYEKYGAEAQTYDLIGRVHLDYMKLYQKYTYIELHSYSLDAVSEHELNEKKVEYTGTLDDLYNNDFEKFIKYNREDTFLVAKLDRKLKFIDLSNTIAHANTVLIPKTMGAVAVTEQAIINEAHEKGFIVPTKIHISEDINTHAAGAYVAYPKKGIHKYVGSYDINSLYPSVIRALNMAPETVIAQLRPTLTDAYIAQKSKDTINSKGKKVKGATFTEAWEGKFGTLEYDAVMERRKDIKLIIDWQEGGHDEFTAEYIHEVIFGADVNWCISANGTIFTLDKEGIIPGLLAKWYAERKVMQKKKREATTPDEKAYWDKQQLVKKILLNSLYGAILNQHCRFFDMRIGQSTTLTGRQIVKNMTETANEVFTGVKDYTGESIIYNDTDSVYISAWPMFKDAVESGEQEWNTDIAIALYDSVTDELNTEFPKFMDRAFHVPRAKGELIKCGREVVAQSGLFITKKRYALMVNDNEGDRYADPGKVKAMGLDLKRSDTLPIVQEFLKDILNTTLISADKDIVIEKIKDFKEEFQLLDPWKKGSPKRVNKLTKYVLEEQLSVKKFGKSARLPGHVRGAMNYNYLRKLNNDNYSMEISDGMKCIVCKLQDNPMGFSSIAIPTDEHKIPQWFKDLAFDDKGMLTAQVDRKVDNLLGILGWDLAIKCDINSSFNDLFEF